MSKSKSRGRRSGSASEEGKHITRISAASGPSQQSGSQPAPAPSPKTNTAPSPTSETNPAPIPASGAKPENSAANSAVKSGESTDNPAKSGENSAEKSPKSAKIAPETAAKSVKPSETSAKSEKTPQSGKNSKKSGKSKPLPAILRPFAAFGRYVRDSWAELRLVRWPSRKTTWQLCITVILYCAAVMLFVLLLDTFFSWLFGLLLSK